MLTWQRCMQTVRMILGHDPAPWEDPDTACGVLLPMGIFKGAVLRLLSRNPDRRLTIRKFQHNCHRLLECSASGS